LKAAFDVWMLFAFNAYKEFEVFKSLHLFGAGYCVLSGEVKTEKWLL